MRRTSSLSGPDTRYCSGQPTGGPSSSGETRDIDLRELLSKRLLESLLQPLARLEILRNDHELREERIRELHVQREDEADRAASHIRAEVIDVGVGLHDRFESLHLCLVA